MDVGILRHVHRELSPSHVKKLLALKPLLFSLAPRGRNLLEMEWFPSPRTLDNDVSVVPSGFKWTQRRARVEIAFGCCAENTD